MNSLLETSKEDDNNLVGKNPLKVTKEEWLESGLPLEVGMKAIRAKCVDCAGAWVEVRKCVCVTCPLWPLRMGKYPKAFKDAREVKTS